MLLTDITKIIRVLLGAFETDASKDELTQPRLGRIGQWWVEARVPSKEETAAHIINLLWMGLRGMERDPRLVSLSPDEA